MGAKIACSCGKQYAWKPQLAGKRAKCKCGAVVSFPAKPPVVVEEFVEDAPPLAPPAYNAPPVKQATSKSASSGPPLIARIGILAGGLALLGFFAIWPMIQASRGDPEINIMFKGIILAAMLTMVGLNLVFLGDKGIPWKKEDNTPATPMQKAMVVVTVVAALALVGGIWLFFNVKGYEIKF